MCRVCFSVSLAWSPASHEERFRLRHFFFDACRQMCVQGEHIPWKRTTKICCTTDTCTKTFQSRDAFERELRVYNMGLVDANADAMQIVMENAGAPLGTFLETVRHVLPQGWVDILPDRRRQGRGQRPAPALSRGHATVSQRHAVQECAERRSWQALPHRFRACRPVLTHNTCHGRASWNLDGIDPSRSHAL